MKANYNTEKATKLENPLKIVYEISGEGGGCWSMVCNTDSLEINEGEIEGYEAKITYRDLESFFKVSNGEISGLKAYVKKLITVDGSQSLLKKFQGLIKA
jgi:hypothetical protein